MELITVNGRSYVTGYYKWLLTQKDSWTFVNLNKKVNTDERIFIVFRGYRTDYNQSTTEWLVGVYSQESKYSGSDGMKFIRSIRFSWNIDYDLTQMIFATHNLQNLVIIPENFWDDRILKKDYKLVFRMDDFDHMKLNNVTEFIKRLEDHYSVLSKPAFTKLSDQELVDIIYDNPYLRWHIHSPRCKSLSPPKQISKFNRILALKELERRKCRDDPMIVYMVCKTLIEGLKCNVPMTANHQFEAILIYYFRSSQCLLMFRILRRLPHINLKIN